MHIRVLDVNDNTPNCSSIVSIQVDDAPETRELLGWIRANDPDEGVNGSLTYRLQQPNEYFEVRPRGEVYTQKRLDSTHLKSRLNHRLAVIVEDQGVEQRSIVCQLTIRIGVLKDSRINDILVNLDDEFKKIPEVGDRIVDLARRMQPTNDSSNESACSLRRGGYNKY